LVERGGQHVTCAGAFDVGGIPTSIGRQHGKPRRHGFYEDGAGVFSVCGMNEKIGALQEARYIVAPGEDAHLTRKLQTPGKPQKRSRVILPDCD
jgi:hypothetical protein